MYIPSLPSNVMSSYVVRIDDEFDPPLMFYEAQGGRMKRLRVRDEGEENSR